MNKFIRAAFVAAICLYFPVRSMAWGTLGHRVVAEVAEHHLNSKTRKAIARIIGPGSLAMEANWLDFIKSDPAYNYLYNWHFVNMPSGWDFDKVNNFLQTDTGTNAYNRVNFVIAELKKKDLPQDKKLLYLRVLVHVLGDLHQPMHVGHKEDLGGNQIKITWFNKPTNLHALWDEALLDFQNLSYTEYANALDHPSKTQAYDYVQGNLANWIFGSYKIASALYSEAEKDTKFSYRYNFDHISTANEQLLKGGLRLAKVLNDIFS